MRKIIRSLSRRPILRNTILFFLVGSVFIFVNKARADLGFVITAMVNIPCHEEALYPQLPICDVEFTCIDDLFGFQSINEYEAASDFHCENLAPVENHTYVTGQLGNDYTTSWGAGKDVLSGRYVER